MSTDHPDTSPAHDLTAETGGPTDASTLNAATAARSHQAAKRAKIRTAWSKRPIVTGLRRVALPAAAIGGLSAVFAEYGPGATWAGTATVTAVSVPVLRSIEFLGRKAGELKGLGDNFFKGTLLQQVFSEIAGTAASKTGATLLLVMAQANAPIYKAIAVDIGHKAGQVATFIDDRLRGHYNKPGGAMPGADQHSSITIQHGGKTVVVTKPPANIIG